MPNISARDPQRILPDLGDEVFARTIGPATSVWEEREIEQVIGPVV